MKIFLGAESQAPAADMLSRLNRIISREMLTLDAKDYGRELNDIAIIVILLQNECMKMEVSQSADYFKGRNVLPTSGFA